MNKQPWNFSKQKILDYTQGILEGGGYIRISNGYDTIVIEVNDNGEIWDADMYEWSTMLTIASGQAVIDMDDGDLVEFAKEIGGRPFTDKEIGQELAAIQATRDLTAKDFREARQVLNSQVDAQLK